MVASTDQKSRLFDLMINIGEMVREGKRDAGEVADVFQVIKDHKNFAERLSTKPALEIRIPALTRMASSEIRRKYGFNSVERDDSPTGEVVIVLDSVLRDGESSVSGKEYETRLRTVQGKLGLSQALWLVEYQDQLPSWFMELLGNVWVDFPATIAVGSDGGRGVPCLGRGGSRWYLRWGWLVDDFRSYARIARSRK